ncbi:TVP38/TMEM64 family protein [Candidatus Woesearchaeota archaeon]|nr:TVP38/TMEM64 family protein [Candidatus Woesearchaeota archaeon]
MKVNKLKIILLLIFLILAIILGKFTSSSEFLNREYLQSYILSFGILAPIVFILVYILATIFFFPGTPLSIVAGIVFGGIKGTIYTIIGASIGAILAFYIARILGRDYVDSLLKNKFKKLDKYDVKLKENGFLTTLFLRLVPLFPFNGLNFALGVTKVKAGDFFIATLIGIIPGSYILVNIGDASNMFSLRLLILILAFVCLALIPTCYKICKRKFARRKKR